MKLFILCKTLSIDQVKLTKTLSIMKITAILLLTGCLQISARGFTQGISLSVRNASLETVFSELHDQTGYAFFYDLKEIKEAKPVTIDVKNTSLEEVLNRCFKDQPLTYIIVSKTVVVKPKPFSKEMLPPSDNQSLLPVPIDISGRVTDKDGHPLEGASVLVKGTKNGTTTDANGVFILKNVSARDQIVISYSGYQSQTLTIGSKASFSIALEISQDPLDQVQIIAYGSQSRRYSTGNVSTVSGEEIQRQPVPNALEALEGRVPGVFITQSTGEPGSGISVLIQGQNSVTNGNDPFYVIDGVPYIAQLLPNLGNVLGTSSSTFGSSTAQAGNPLSFINPSDIESISVLKGADATSIFGSRAANGAILITTKKGKAGQTKVTVNLQTGWGQITKHLNELNTQQYLQMRHEALRNDQVAPSATNYDVNGLLWDTTRYTDWQKVLIGGTAQYTNLSGDVSGGNQNTQYLVGATYRCQTSVFPGDFADQTGALHLNINSASTNQRFRLQFTGNYLVDDNRLPNADLTGSAIQLAPDAPPLYKSDGTLNWEQNSAGTSTWSNPLRYILTTYRNNTNNLVSNLVLRYQIINGLEISSSFGYNRLQSNETVVLPQIYQAPENASINLRSATYSYNTIESWIAEPQLTYKRSIGKGRLEALLGTTINTNNSSGLQIAGSGYNSDEVLQNIKSAGTLSVGSNMLSIYRYNAGFGRINYNWNDKYIVNLTGRRDGSSRFGPANEFHDFWSVGGAWLFSNESFIKDNLKFLSFGKLSGSYGTTGNDQIGDYKFLNLYNPIAVTVGAPYQGITTLVPNGLTNPYLKWEETRKLEGAVNLGFLRDRIIITITYFKNRSSNELLSYPLPYITGFNSIARNFPATVQNSGWEFTMNTINVKTKNFSWSSGINLSAYRNKLIAFPSLASSSYANALVIGQPVSLLKTFHFLGVDPTTGVYVFADSHGNPTSLPNSATDRLIYIDRNPAFYGGIENRFNYKGLELDMLFQFTKRMGPNYFFGVDPGIANDNQPANVLMRWQKPGDITQLQRFFTTALLTQYTYASQLSDAGFSDASYIRLKNLALSYLLPQYWQKKAHLQNARIYVQGQNILTFTKYPGLDPETLSSTTLPPLRVLTLGLQVGL